MHLRFAVTISSLAFTLPFVSSSAQTTAQTTAPEPAKWSLSVGLDSRYFDLNTPEPGINARMVANLTRSWQSGNSRWARHISLMVGADAPRDAQSGIPSLFGLPPCVCSMHVSRRYAALTGGVSYDLLRISRFTPYISGGTGIYYSGFRRRIDGVLTPSELAFYRKGVSWNDFSLGANAGLGLKVRLGSHELFIEQMLHRFDIGGRTSVYPLNIGMRF